MSKSPNSPHQYLQREGDASMRFIDEFRRPEVIAYWVGKIRSCLSRSWKLMEICGGQTHNILKFGIDRLLPPEVELVHGPGCPVCVTPTELIDRAINLSLTPGVVLCTFGDMMRVPGSKVDLLTARSQGGSILTLYSPLDALKLAQSDPIHHYIFFAIGFETTAPVTALAVKLASQLKLANFSLLVAHLIVPPAVEAILSSPHNTIQGLLAPGHVCSVTGWKPYEPLAERYHTPIVVTGFEPADILQGIAMTLNLLERGEYRVEAQYSRVVKREGNVKAIRTMEEVFEVTDRNWRGIGPIPYSGLALKPQWAQFDAEKRFPDEDELMISLNEEECLAGKVLQGVLKPNQCPHFGIRCHPERPLGAPMVSSEGACAAYYQYRLAESLIPSSKTGEFPQ